MWHTRHNSNFISGGPGGEDDDIGVGSDGGGGGFVGGGCDGGCVSGGGAKLFQALNLLRILSLRKSVSRYSVFQLRDVSDTCCILTRNIVEGEILVPSE